MEDPKPIVVCVDDEPAVLASLRRALRREPYELFTTANPGEALRVAGDRDVGVLVTDHRMPGMTGAELLGAIEERSPRTEGVLLTAYPGAPPVIERASHGRVRLIAKPWVDDELRRTIRELLEQRDAGGRGKATPVELRTTPDVFEPLFLVDCRGRRARPLLGEIDRLWESCAEAKSAAFVLESLRLLEDSLLGFLRDLLDRLVPWDVAVSFVDPSGQVAGAVELLETTGAVAVYGPEVLGSDPRRVLVLAGERDTLAYLRALVAGTGHAVEAARSVTEVLPKLAGGSFDLALLDLAAPGGGAIALSQNLLARNSRMDVVALSSFRDLWDDETCARLGFWRRLEKPYRVSELLLAVQEGGLRREPGGGRPA